MVFSESTALCYNLGGGVRVELGLSLPLLSPKFTHPGPLSSVCLGLLLPAPHLPITFDG